MTEMKPDQRLRWSDQEVAIKIKGQRMSERLGGKSDQESPMQGDLTAEMESYKQLKWSNIIDWDWAVEEKVDGWVIDWENVNQEIPTREDRTIEMEPNQRLRWRD